MTTKGGEYTYKTPTVHVGVFDNWFDSDHQTEASGLNTQLQTTL